MTYRGPGSGFEPVQYPADGCVRGGCQLSHALDLLGQLEKRATTVADLAKYEGILSLWCSRGAHSFSELDPGSVVIPKSTGRNAHGEEVTIPAQAICGNHAAALGTPRTRPAELEAPKDHYDPNYTAALEREAGLRND
jgi:hypothetical protein